jgi:hypothetical protein
VVTAGRQNVHGRPLQPAQDPPLDTWTHAAFDVVLSNTAGSVSLVWNGTTTAATGAGIATTADPTFTTIGIEILFASVGSTSPNALMLIDNVSVDLN